MVKLSNYSGNETNRPSVKPIRNMALTAGKFQKTFWQTSPTAKKTSTIPTCRRGIRSRPKSPLACWRTWAGFARNLALNRYKARKSQKRGGDFAFSLEELDICTPSGLTVESELDRRRLGRSLNTFLHTQPEDVQVVFVRRYFFCDSIEMIAKRFGYSQSKVKSMLLRTRQRLRIYLEKEGYYEK